MRHVIFSAAGNTKSEILQTYSCQTCLDIILGRKTSAVEAFARRVGWQGQGTCVQMTPVCYEDRKRALEWRN